MSLVNVLRFNEHCGGLISDEEFWNIRFRRRLYCDNLHSLVDADVADALDLEVCYGGAAYPSLHWEVVTGAREILRKRFDDHAKAKKKGPPFKTVREVGSVVLEVLQKVVRRRIDQRLNFYYGFSSDDVNRGFFEKDGEKIEIKQEKVLEKARGMASYKERDRLLKLLFTARAVVFGYDEPTGITGYYVDPEHSVLCFNYEGFDSLGAGKFAAGLSLGRFLNAKPLTMRKKGLDRTEGMFELILSALTASDHFHEVGGNMNLVYIDGKGKNHRERYREIFDDTARLASEVVRAHMAGLLGRKEAIALLDGLIFAGAPLSRVEKGLFSRVSDTRAFEYVLRRYKLDEALDITSSTRETQPPAPRTSGGRARTRRTRRGRRMEK